ncbi:MAG: hypothetical protein LKG11_02810 [Bacilli bacterium]|jgi:hypothetical protein|nr:hypothetical protein [Bacilli bacterium]
MERTVTLNGKELRLASSLFTIISYRGIFGTELFEDVDRLEKAVEKNQNEVGRFVDILFRLVYVLHKPFTNDSYDQFLQGFDFSVLSNTEELTNLAKVIGELLGSINSDHKGDTASPQK